MTVRRHSPDYNFCGDPSSGVTLRWGRTLAESPLRAPWPELADIAIGNRCSKGCPFCYRDSQPDGPLMSLDAYEFVLERLRSERWGSVFQVALGGGEPLEHPDLLGILDATVERGVVPNFTTNGELVDRALAREIAKRAGAVAVSARSLSSFARSAMNALVAAGVRTNIHFVLSESSLDEACAILEGRFDGALAGLNALVFLTYKPKGRAGEGDCLLEGPRLERFIKLAERKPASLRIGFDACFVPPLLKSSAVEEALVDSCECGFFSVFVDESLRVSPCSFNSGEEPGFDLRSLSLEEIWEEGFAPYRRAVLERRCADESCSSRGSCRGACPLFKELKFCFKPESEVA